METLIIAADKKARWGTRRLASRLVICFLGSAFGGAISALMSTYLAVAVKELEGQPTPGHLNYIGAYVNSVFIFGWVAGGFSWGLISDRIGRKTALLLAIFNSGLFTLLAGFMPYWSDVVFCRLVSGFGVGGVLVISFTYLSEVWPEKSRAAVTGILSISFPVGVFSAGMISYIAASWREAFFIGAAPLLLAIAGYRFIAESAPWLQHRSKTFEQPAPVRLLLSRQNRRALAGGAIIFGAMLIGLWAIFSWLPTWVQSLFAADANKERGLSMMFMGMGGLVGGFFSGWLLKVMSLRYSLITCFAMCALFSFILFKTNHSFSDIIYVEIVVLALFFGLSQGILSIYIPLLFPTAIRASATGICFNAGRLFTAVAVLFVGILVSALGGYGNAIFIFSLVFVIGLVTVLIFKNIGPARDFQ